MSPAQVTSGAGGLKSRRTSSLAGVAALSTMVVRTVRRPSWPTRPRWRMIRATRLTAVADPVSQRRVVDPQLLRDLGDVATARLDEADGLGLELRRERSPAP